MYIDTKGIILRQVKTLDGGRMLHLFTPDLGKISVGVSHGERGKNKSALPLRPFTLGKYTLYKKRNSYYLNRAETLKSFYAIGENVNKYMHASYALEYTDKLISDDMPSRELFNLFMDFLDLMQGRECEHGTLLVAYIIKTFRISGVAPILTNCTHCEGQDFENNLYFSVKDGGLLCEKCSKIALMNDDSLILAVNFGIVKIFNYILNNSLYSLKNLAIEDDLFDTISVIVGKYGEYHLGISNLKSAALV